uniref:Protein FAR1-RELATED SEQUENCE n=1 Tax=Ananas comosus var. bracteatus TaxID=296719 RepID=A0A6V7P840_ANACO|nr:unnamed protein product [Ananas comosus var. bracteatus]
MKIVVMESSSYVIEDVGEGMQLDGSRDNRQEVEKEDGEEAEKEIETSLVLIRRAGINNLLGQVVNSEEEAYRLYCDFGHRMGFSVRKGKQNYFVGPEISVQKITIAQRKVLDTTSCLLM